MLFVAFYQIFLLHNIHGIVRCPFAILFASFLITEYRHIKSEWH